MTSSLSDEQSARASLAAQQDQLPVAEVTAFGDTIRLQKTLPVGTKLYTHPAPQAPQPEKAQAEQAVAVTVRWPNGSLDLMWADEEPDPDYVESRGKPTITELVPRAAPTAPAVQQEDDPMAIPLNIIRWWPDGFADRLEKVWLDLIGLIPNYKLYDLQRVLAEFGFTMTIHEAAPPQSPEAPAAGAAPAQPAMSKSMMKRMAHAPAELAVAQPPSLPQAPQPDSMEPYPTSASSEINKTALPEGCTPADARILREACFTFASEEQRLRKALRYYADKGHFMLADDSAWDTVSGEPRNFWCDEAGTATIEDGSIAAMALRGIEIDWSEDEPPLCPGEPEALIAAGCEAQAEPVEPSSSGARSDKPTPESQGEAVEAVEILRTALLRAAVTLKITATKISEVHFSTVRVRIAQELVAINAAWDRARSLVGKGGGQ